MTVALWDIVHLSRALKNICLDETKLVTMKVSAIHWHRKHLASVVNILANALYALFSAGDDPAMIQLQNACFAYFELGGKCVSTPIGLLAG